MYKQKIELDCKARVGEVESYHETSSSKLGFKVSLSFFLYIIAS